LGPHDPTGFGYIAPFERRLTPSGVELIRSGTVPVDAFLEPAGRCPDDQGVPDQTCVMVTEGQRQSLAAAWAESRYRPYVPTAYAVCFSDGVTAVNTYSSVVHPTTVSQALSMLPGPAERLLRGRERTYRDERWMDPAPRECAEVTRDDAGVLLGLLQEVGFDIDGVSPDELLGEGLEVLGEGRWGVTLWKPAWPWTQPVHSAIAVAFVPLLPNGMPWPSLGVPP
jgi:hypothetical protein